MKHPLKSRGRDASSSASHAPEDVGSSRPIPEPDELETGEVPTSARATPASPGLGAEASPARHGANATTSSGGAAPVNDPDIVDPAGATLTPPANEALAELKDKWLRAEADLQNVRRRAQRDLEEGLRFAEEQVLLEMISWLDDLERAVEVARESGAPENWIQGVQLVAQRMTEYLARRDVKALHPLGETFDPRFHEALLEIDAPEAPPGSITQVVRKGYQRGDRALRAARVVVARRAARSET